MRAIWISVLAQKYIPTFVGFAISTPNISIRYLKSNLVKRKHFKTQLLLLCRVKFQWGGRFQGWSFVFAQEFMPIFVVIATLTIIIWFFYLLKALSWSANISKLNSDKWWILAKNSISSAFQQTCIHKYNSKLEFQRLF